MKTELDGAVLKAAGFVRVVAAMTLLIAAAIKAWTAPTILLSGGLLSSPWLLMPVVFGEVFCGICILCLAVRPALQLTLVVYVCLAMAATYALISDSQCNCFGRMFDGRVSLGVDLCIVAATAGVLIALRNSSTRPSSKNFVGVATVLGVVLVSVALVRDRNANAGVDLQYLGAERFVGQRWPIGERYHTGLAPLVDGNWMVLVLNQDCSHCREVVAEYFADSERHRANERTLVFVSDGDEWRFQLDRVAMDIEGDGKIEWKNGAPFVANPAVRWRRCCCS